MLDLDLRLIFLIGIGEQDLGFRFSFWIRDWGFRLKIGNLEWGSGIGIGDLDCGLGGDQDWDGELGIGD